MLKWKAMLNCVNPEVKLEVMTEAVEAYNTARKNKLKVAQNHYRKTTHYEVIKRWNKMLNKVALRKAK